MKNINNKYVDLEVQNCTIFNLNASIRNVLCASATSDIVLGKDINAVFLDPEMPTSDSTSSLLNLISAVCIELQYYIKSYNAL